MWGKVGFRKSLSSLMTLGFLFFSCGKNSMSPEKILGEEEARNLIESVLESNKEKYEDYLRDTSPSFGPIERFRVDYEIKRLDRRTAVINYNGEKDNLEKERANQDVLREYGVPNLYFGRITKSGITLKVNNFINGGFKEFD